MAEISTPPSATRYFSIVVTGLMTPGMHHPCWYHLIGSLSDSELPKALGQVAMGPNFARFQTASDGGISIACNANEWEIGAWKEEDRPRILEIASRVFEKLTEIPLRAYAFFSMTDLDTKSARTKTHLADLATATRLGFEGQGDRDCAFQFIDLQPYRVTTVNVRASEVLPSKIFVHYSTQYTIPPISGYYELGPDLKKNFDPHWEAAKAMGSRVVVRINEMEGVG